MDPSQQQRFPDQALLSDDDDDVNENPFGESQEDQDAQEQQGSPGGKELSLDDDDDYNQANKNQEDQDDDEDQNPFNDENQNSDGSEKDVQLQDGEEEQEAEAEEGELEQEEVEEEQQENQMDEDDDQEEEKQDDQAKSRAKGNDRDKKIRGLLDDEDDESVDELFGDNSDVDKNSKGDKTTIDQKKAQLAEANAATQGAAADAQSALNEQGLPRKRGRPSKKAKLEQEMQERQSMTSKRVKFDDGDKVVYPSDNESEDVPGLGEGEAEGDGGPRLGGLDDDQAYETIVNNANGKSGLCQDAIEIFTQMRRRAVYESLNDSERERYYAFIEACPKPKMQKKLDELIDMLPGQKLKIKPVVQVITSAVKSHASQLIELAKKIQIDEIKQRLAMQHPHQRILEGLKGPVPEDKQFLINGACLSREAQEALVGEMREMGPIQPHHMQEARRQLNQTDAAVMDKPKSMFLRKRFR